MHKEAESTIVIFESEDQEIAGTYEILFRVTLSSYPTNSAESETPFTITIINPCDNPTSLIFSGAAL